MEWWAIAVYVALIVSVLLLFSSFPTVTTALHSEICAFYADTCWATGICSIPDTCSFSEHRAGGQTPLFGNVSVSEGIIVDPAHWTDHR